MPVQADAELSFTLQAQEWQVVMDTLVTGQYRVVATIVQKLAQQFESAQTQPPPAQLRSVE